jgi:hypothetical protein
MFLHICYMKKYFQRKCFLKKLRFGRKASFAKMHDVAFAKYNVKSCEKKNASVNP